jgi:putative two-component system response regulator
VYKPAFTPEEAIRMIQNGECGQFTDVIMECFALAREELVNAVICGVPIEE